jgi:dipeptidase
MKSIVQVLVLSMLALSGKAALAGGCTTILVTAGATEDGYTTAYPFSVAPDIPLTLRDVMDLHRDHYEGTEFDMTQGLTADPFGIPNRYYGPYDGRGDVGDPDRHLEGARGRPLSVAYIGYVYVYQGRNWLPDPVGGSAG